MTADGNGHSTPDTAAGPSLRAGLGIAVVVIAIVSLLGVGTMLAEGQGGAAATPAPGEIAAGASSTQPGDAPDVAYGTADDSSPGDSGAVASVQPANGSAPTTPPNAGPAGAKLPGVSPQSGTHKPSSTATLKPGTTPTPTPVATPTPKPTATPTPKPTPTASLVCTMTVVKPALAGMYYQSGSNYYSYAAGVAQIQALGVNFPAQTASRASLKIQQTWFVPITSGTYAGKLIMMSQAATDSSNYWHVAGCVW
jgi:hypothetical protein